MSLKLLIRMRVPVWEAAKSTDVVDLKVEDLVLPHTTQHRPVQVPLSWLETMSPSKCGCAELWVT